MRSGFTLIELAIVLGIMLLLGSLAAPAMVQASRRAKISEAAGRIHQVWTQARALALTERMDSAAAVPRHYGIVLVQPPSGEAWVGLLYDNRSAAAIAADPAAGLLLRDPAAAVPEPVLRFRLPGGLALGTAAASGGAPAVAPTVLAVYAQFGTGQPIAPVSVVLGQGGNAGLVSIGTRTSPACTPAYPGVVRVMSAAEPQRGANIAIHEAGICVTQVF